jgi:hypothetical protein
MTVKEGPGTHNEKAVKNKRYPAVEGLEAGTTKQTGKKFSHPTKKCLLTRRKTKGMR